MDHFDEKLRQMAAQEEMQVPESLHRRLMEPAPRKRRFVARKLVLFAAVIGILGVVTAGAAYHVIREDMGYYAMEKPVEERTPEPTCLADSAKEIIRDEMEPSTAEDFISAIEAGEIHMMTEEEEKAEQEAYAHYASMYQDEEKQAQAIQAAEDAFAAQALWDAEVTGARFEGTQLSAEYDCAEALVVLYLSDGCGYRMLMDADTLELVGAVGLTPETMESEYFDALWDGTVDQYNAKQAKHAVG